MTCLHLGSPKVHMRLPLHWPIVHPNQCGVFALQDGGIMIVSCGQNILNKETAKHHKPFKKQRNTAYQLWSSSFQATDVIGRRFDKILKGRAQFRQATDTVAVVSLVVASELLETSNRMAYECRVYKRNCDAAKGAMGAAAIAGGISAISFLIGQSTNPRADLRHITDLYEKGFIVVPPAGAQ